MMAESKTQSIHTMDHSSLSQLERVFSNYSEIEAVYLFGSQATGKIHQASDVDLALYPDTQSLRNLKLDILHDLAKLGFCHIDLVYMSSNDIVLQYEIVRLNRIIYQKPEFDKGSLFSKIIRQYLDFLPYLAEQRKAYKNRILNGTS